jgi:hypothetical protein
MLKRAVLFIPLTFNDGTRVPEETLIAIEREIFQAFHGWTVSGEVTGAYRMRQSKDKQVDKLLHVWIVLEESAISTLKNMVARFGSLLGQEAMYFEVIESSVEFIPSLPREHTSDE